MLSDSGFYADDAGLFMPDRQQLYVIVPSRLWGCNRDEMLDSNYFVFFLPSLPCLYKGCGSFANARTLPVQSSKFWY